MKMFMIFAPEYSCNGTRATSSIICNSARSRRVSGGCRTNVVQARRVCAAAGERTHASRPDVLDEVHGHQRDAADELGLEGAAPARPSRGLGHLDARPARLHGAKKEQNAKCFLSITRARRGLEILYCGEEKVFSLQVSLGAPAFTMASIGPIENATKNGAFEWWILRVKR